MKIDIPFINCIDCGGEMFGDGYTTIEYCENIMDDEQYCYNAPDEGPVYCGGLSTVEVCHE